VGGGLAVKRGVAIPRNRGGRKVALDMWSRRRRTATIDPMRSAAARLGLVVVSLIVLAWFISLTNHDGWLTLWFLLFIFLGIPLFVLTWVDLGRALRQAESPTRLTFVLGIFFGLPQVVFGLIAVACGISILAWVAYNSFFERQPQYTGGFLTFGLGPALVLMGWYWLREAFVKSRAGLDRDRGPENALDRTRD